MKGGWGEREKEEEHGVAKAVEKAALPQGTGVLSLPLTLRTASHGCLTALATMVLDHVSLSHPFTVASRSLPFCSMYCEGEIIKMLRDGLKEHYRRGR